MTRVREVRIGAGEARYQFVVDMGTGLGKRQQVTRRYRTREEAEERLAAYLAARKEWRQPSGGVLVTDLFLERRCHPMCVFALGVEADDCACVCEGRFHGRLTELRCDWAYLETAPVRSKSTSKRARPMSPDVRRRVLALREEALAHPYYRYKPAAFIREELAKEGVEVTQTQVNGWFQHLRGIGVLPAATARTTRPTRISLPEPTDQGDTS
jgi:hypothetical protein